MTDNVTSIPSPSATAIGMAARGRGLHVALWIVQVLLAVGFGMAGTMKATAPIAELVKMGLGWTSQVPELLVRFIGTAELAGALGLILPSLTRVKPWLTPLAALGLVLVMLLAVPFHLMHGEANLVGVPVMMGALATFVAWGRYSKGAIAARD